MRLHRIFVDRSMVAGGKAAIVGPEAHHVRTVLRLKPGDRLIGCDGLGSDYLLRIERSGPDALVCEVLSIMQPQSPECRSRIVLMQCCLSSGKMEQVVDRAIQLGVSGIVPIVSEKSKFRGDEKQFNRKVERWRRIARSSALQCGRAHFPVIEPISPLMHAIKTPIDNAVRLLFTTDTKARSARQVLPGLLSSPSERQVVYLLIGPEAGLSPVERKTIIEHGFTAVMAGRRILRAEMAPIVALALVLYHLGEL
ncbi:MAG: hypothetical protein DRH70_00075 [Candidatus Coatesbacteria bacterium]|nr:MAG: hypothetical protein DRH70_00075 [Candidatus Coatesbacteria bacterium]